MPDSAGPLAGLPVLDLSTIVSGGTVTSMLADFGADVIKVEHPKGGDPLRTWGPFVAGQSVWWKIMARNKKSVTLDLSRARGQELLLDLATRADVLVENFRPGTLERWNLGPDRLHAANPKLVVLRVSGFGQTGPYRHRPGFGTVAEAMSGIVAISGFPDSPPLAPPMPLADEVAGLMGAFAILAALRARDARASLGLRREPETRLVPEGGEDRGTGQVIDVSLYEPLFRLLIPHITQYTALGIEARRTGNHFPDAAPRNLYRTADGGWIAISATSQRVFERLAAAIGQPDLVEDPRFRDNPARVRHHEALDAILAAWFGANSEPEALARLEEAGAVAGPVYDVPRILNDPHYAARDDIATVHDPDAGDLRMPGVVPKFSDTPGALRHAGPALGAHNNEIYARLGLDAAEIERLRAEGVI
ncbi:MAG TPA: CaiB/BaiF CoA-transferase family protein [bacterium]|nr:CaiB/BaiF CoA-transferase family protein [bacterium]